MTIRLIPPRRSDPGPLDQNERNVRTRLLITHLGFTADEAAAFLNGDHQALDTVTRGRKQTADDLLSRQVNSSEVESFSR